MGRSLNLTWAKPKKEKKPSAPAQPKTVPVHNLFVANLPFQARSKDLMEFFSAGNTNVVSAEIIFNEKPRGSAGYGFVSFNTKQEAEAALSAFQGKVIFDRSCCRGDDFNQLTKVLVNLIYIIISRGSSG